MIKKIHSSLPIFSRPLALESYVSSFNSIYSSEICFNLFENIEDSCCLLRWWFYTSLYESVIHTLLPAAIEKKQEGWSDINVQIITFLSYVLYHMLSVKEAEGLCCTHTHVHVCTQSLQMTEEICYSRCRRKWKQMWELRRVKNKQETEGKWVCLPTALYCFYSTKEL